ncbi:DUF4236 domain-containing protein [Rodentibacter sp. Ppn85]|uniref:DUF4236 domain-containing protein n=1 Tax=Rodentibacter sp. Ppn85 TaxID=1908525 RepID=UPI0009845C0A|nr:DUF4236 domain-containing protein [Rodentibacter sp. Ppn85]OOF63846.1 hypothetical protein BKL51_08065 [Rodentibacter sp. Ppn85]
MAFKFRKRIKVLPGVTVNLSKSGISTTLGIKGASVNVGKNGAYLNTGIPGTGIYSRTRILSPNQSEKGWGINIPTTKERKMANISIGKELERLVKLRDQGILTESEFLAQKERLLMPNNDSSELNFDYIYSAFLSRSKNRMTAGWLALFTGFMGWHKFYLGQPIWGILYLLLLPSGLSILLSIFDVFYLVFMSDERFLTKYNAKVLSSLGVDINNIDRNSEIWDLLVRNSGKFRHNSGILSTILKIILLVIVVLMIIGLFAQKNGL